MSTKGRAQIYYPANQLSEVRIAAAGEFIVESTFEPYEGPYVEANGQFIVGSKPRLGDDILKRVEGIGGIKFREPLSTEYFKLTRKEYTNHYAPSSVSVEPSVENYEDGEYMRYFVQKKNELHKIYEIDEDQAKEMNRDNNVGIDSRMYNLINIRWMLTGKDAVQNNITNIQIKDRQYPGFKDYLTTPADYVREVILDIRTYDDGQEISNNLPTAYGIPTITNQACLNCQYRHNNYCSRWIAQIRRNYWCQSWQMSKKPNLFKASNSKEFENLYTNGNEYLLNGQNYIGSYHIHPTKGAMVGAYHVSEPHEYLTKIN